MSNIREFYEELGYVYLLDEENEMAAANTSYFQIKREIKTEVLSEEEDEYNCRLCTKCFSNETALQNHAKIAHIEAYISGDPTVWTKEIIKKPKVETKQEDFTNITDPNIMNAIASSNFDYIILKSDDPPVQKKKKKEDEVKEAKRPGKRTKTVQVITGPFECLEPSNVGSDGACHQMFFSCCEYSSHVRQDHARRRRAARCQVCERVLPADRSHHCTTCGEGFDTEEELQEHAANHVKLKKYECGVCHKRFTQQGGVQQHMRMHTGDRPYPCTMCPKAFTQKSGLEQHLRTHTKVKPYRCVVCAKSFCQSVHLKQHMRTHTNLAPFQCGICDKRFKQSSHLNYHLKNHNPAHLTPEQREKYNLLVGRIKNNISNENVIIETELVDDGSYNINEPYVYIENGSPSKVVIYESE